MLFKVLANSTRCRLWKPGHLRLIARDIFSGRGMAVGDHRTHLATTIDWLCRAQDVREGDTDQGGVSAGFTFEDGWLPSYPETSGYIVETFLAAASALARPDLILRAHRILDWESTIQRDDGGIPERYGEPGSRPFVFNTGQVVHGWVAGHEVLGRDDCLENAIRACRWLIEAQDEDGCWRRHVYNDVPHVYNTRTAWALARVGALAGSEEFTAAARRNLAWALAQQTASGWFLSNSFEPGIPPFTHTIAYAIRGILECAVLLHDDEALRAAVRAAQALARCQRVDGWLAGSFEDSWRTTASYCCLTGLAQTVLVWQRLAQLDAAGADHEQHIRRGIRYLEQRHALRGPIDVRGALAGSFPLWGAYSRFEFPNWAPKFLADALLMDAHAILVPTDLAPVSE